MICLKDDKRYSRALNPGHYGWLSFLSLETGSSSTPVNVSGHLSKFAIGFFSERNYIGVVSGQHNLLTIEYLKICQYNAFDDQILLHLTVIV